MNEAIIAVTIAVVATIPTLILYASQRRKNNGDAYSSLSSAIGNLSRRVGELETERAKDHDEIMSLKRTLSAWRRGIETLINQLLKAGHVPAWRPDDEDT